MGTITDKVFRAMLCGQMQLLHRVSHLGDIMYVHLHKLRTKPCLLTIY